jgi:hypothetical protein
VVQRQGQVNGFTAFYWNTSKVSGDAGDPAIGIYRRTDNDRDNSFVGGARFVGLGSGVTAVITGG